MPQAPPLPDPLLIFNAQPGANLLLSPAWVIMGASDDYLAATLTERAVIVGQYIFDAFPDNPDTPEANDMANVRASLEQVLASGQPHEMAPQHYDVPDRAHPGRFVERHWLPRHTPVLDAAGQVQCIIQSVQDITATRVAERQLRESQASEQEARADAEQQRQRLHEVLMQLPAYVAAYQGPDHDYQFVNPPYQGMFPHRTFLGRPFREGIPEAEALGVVALFDQVYQTGEPFYAHEMEGWFDFHGTGEPEQVFLNLSLHPLRNAQGAVDGVLDFSYNVTEQVRARQQLEQFNQELETQVQARTRQALALQAEVLAAAQRQAGERALVFQVFEQTPACIALLRGPEQRFEYANQAYQSLFPGRELAGHPLAQVLPDAAEQGFLALLDGVYRTGETFFGSELPLAIAQPDGQPPRQAYFTFTYQAYYEHRQVVGTSIFAFDVTEQVLGRQQREAERQQLHALFMGASAPICILDGPDLVFQLVNPAYQRIFPGRELLGKALLEALPELTATPVFTELQAVYDTGAPLIVQERRVPLARLEGARLEDLYFTFNYEARRTAAGAVDGVLCIGHEVTEQVRARQQAELNREELKRFQFMADQARDPFILMREDGTFAYLNPKALTAWGYTAEEARHLRVPDVDPIYQDAEFTRVFAEAQRDTLPQFETLHRHKDGRIFPVEVSMGGLRLNGQPHLFAIARDITEQKRYVAALQESEARFRTMADAAPNLVWAVHPDSSVRYINRAFLDFVGLDRVEQYVASGWSPYLHPDELEPTRNTLTQAIAQRQPYVMEHRMRRHDGQYRWLLAQGAPSYLSDGELYGYVGSAIDITDLKQTNELLTRTNVDLDNFIYTASHDLKAPISNIEGLLYLLQEELPATVAQAEAVGPTLTRMLDAVERFKRTIDHLTEVSKLQKEHTPATVAVNLAAIIEDVRQDLVPQLQAAGAKLVVNVGALPPIQFSEKNLRSVVYNLLSNAVKYRSPDRPSRVDVRGHVRDGYTVLEVHDNGLGLAADHLPRLFTMFQRFHDHVDGTGIGLYMVKRMVENAGGRIEVHSQLGAGTAFFVFLPQAAPTA
ncbi:PAS domain-containing sensor histidine kinase [Hymenobacter arizonensis]|uniref:histidine kinase n=1 Tax=Hymenobacter arizonensis TaxID=1227077 RepID=A0A1I6BRF7_HYMAR|nr:PAS domain-containing protein [Hymenobacter arizonensis]SFQ83509.1 PAS domain S-box-containing protein [Hymenobacter arizonensis]